MDIKFVFGMSAVVVGIAGYAYYLRDLFRGKTKPHAFSWFVWGVLTSIAFAAQVVDGAGPGAWVTGLSAFVCFFIAGIALHRGTKTFPMSDWLALLACGIALILWAITDTPVLSIILITVTDILAFLPTFRKSFFKPYEETIAVYVSAIAKFLLGLLALNTISLTTALYTGSLVLMNGIFVLLVIVRRRQSA